MIGRFSRVFCLALLLVAGCAGPMRGAVTAERQEIAGFRIEARFSLQLSVGLAHGDIGQGGSGRLLWQHGLVSDKLIFSSPFGNVLAQLHSDRDGASLRLASGEERQARDARTLLQGLLSFPLPLDRMPHWLLGQGGAAAEVRLDEYHRPQYLAEEGWVIEYSYDDAQPSALPSRLNLKREGELELRLRIEEWQINP